MEKPYANSEVELFELITRILCDDIPAAQVNAVCVFAQTVENEMPMLETAASAFRGGSRYVAVSGYVGMESVCLKVHGFFALAQKLVDLGVRESAILQFPLSKKLPPCTDAEAMGLVEYATKQGWKSLALTLPPLHQVRGMVSLISAVVKAGSPLRVYGTPSYAPSWTEVVFHSESEPRAPRHAQFAGELRKLKRYLEQGSHMSPGEVLDYLNLRDM